MKIREHAVLCLVLLLIGGCSPLGPSSIARDRLNYSGALSESWKDQMLLNVVKTRYLDLPIYLEVGQIVSGYSLETAVNASSQLARTGAGDTFVGLGASGTFTDRPTITYTPSTGEGFLRNFLTPILPGKVLALVQSGYAADFLLELTVDSLNGLHNSPVTLGSKRIADPEFFQVLALLREIQDAGAMGMRVEQQEREQTATVTFFRDDRIEAGVLAKIEQAKALLGLAPGQFVFRVVQSPLPGSGGDVLGIATRSLMQIMAALSAGVEIPQLHQQRNLTPVFPAATSGEARLLRVHSGPDRPDGAFVSVPYEGQWFWIANDDWRSKRTFSSILFLFTLADTGGSDRLPVLTIPAQ